jgi:hypothetical protein
MTIIVITKDELLRLVGLETLYLANPSGVENTPAGNKLQDIVPLLKEDMPFFETRLYEVGINILKEVIPYVKEIDVPYTITDSEDEYYPDSIIFSFNLPETSQVGVAIPIIQQEILNTISGYIIKEWLKSKQYPYKDKEEVYFTSLSEIKSAFMCGRKTTLKYKPY